MDKKPSSDLIRTLSKVYPIAIFSGVMITKNSLPFPRIFLYFSWQQDIPVKKIPYANIITVRQCIIDWQSQKFHRNADLKIEMASLMGNNFFDTVISAFKI